MDRVAEAWHQMVVWEDRPEEAIGEGLTSVAIETPELEGLWREPEALLKQTLKETKGRPLVKM